MSDEHTGNNEVKVEEPETPRTESKKARKNRLLQKRTKTGCMTCRHRRVKCDEQHPICKKCIKSRRPCMWFPPEHPSNALQINQRNLHHADLFRPQSAFPYRPFEDTQMHNFTNFAALTSVTAVGTVTQHPPNIPDTYQVHDPAHLSHGFAAASMYPQPHRWPAEQESWAHPYAATFQQPHFADLNPELYASASMAHSGMLPNSNAVDRQRDVVSQSVSAPALPESPAVHADMRKYSLRRDDSNLTSASSTEHLPPQNLRQQLSRGSSFQDQACFQGLQPFSEDIDTSEDSWEDSSEYGSPEDSALVNLRSAQALAIDERKAYLLRHFVNYIRPCLSLSEPPLKFDGSSSWGEVLPSLALSCPGLLHGLMAASALHLAVLHGTSEAVPTKHFMIASKRLQKLLSAPSSRHELQTLALCLLLSWYEVMNADHARWIMHLGGASSFLLEHVRVAGIPDRLLLSEETAVDERLIKNLTGLDINYTTGAHQHAESIIHEHETTQAAEKEWRVRLDLFWWYIKMDVYHAFLSGDEVLLPYKNWGLCPPRGRIGLIDQVHATIDHLWLVLGRLGDFGGRDRLRKQRQIVASGGQWQPPPDFCQQIRSESAHVGEGVVSNAGQENSGTTKPIRSPSSSKKGQPMNFYGMMPPPAIPPSMLSSFHINDAEMRKHDKPHKFTSTPSSNPDLRMETEIALTEHTAIGDALETWRKSLGSDFDSLHYATVGTDCAFGPSIRYADPLVACMWSLYHLGRILLRRHHPYSPPAMMISAGVNASFTQEDALIIGRINAGLLENQAELARAGSINPTLVAALQELSFALMFAGVQYQSAQQRLWTIENLLDLGRSSGWKSAYAVASALETAWVKQGEMGKGPPYERVFERQGLNNVSRHTQFSPSSSQDMPRCSQSEHESRFVSHDRGLITTYADARAYWAIGVLSSTDDIQEMFARSQITNEQR